MSEMNPHDVKRAAYGYPPIFVSPPRPLTAEEIEANWPGEKPWYFQAYEPVVEHGYLFWRKRA